MFRSYLISGSIGLLAALVAAAWFARLVADALAPLGVVVTALGVS